VLRFTVPDEAAWDDLARRARRGCVEFRDCQLPLGCQPARARLGIEVDSSGAATLLVDRGVDYRGGNAAVRAWLGAGEKRFASFGELRRWIVEEASPLCRAQSDRREPAELTDLEAVTSAVTTHHAAFVTEDDLLRELKTRVYGQDGALGEVARKVSNHVGRSQPQRPATLFALGPTGVGKTRTAQALAESLGSLTGGRWSNLIRLNMNEYSERHRVSQLLGAPPSYIGYGDGTQLVDRLVAQPESVVLFDEIEKAHPDILLTLMSAMDAGELSSAAPAARGRAIDCRRAVFFFTSNIDVTDAITELDSAVSPAESVASICRRHLAASAIRPELVGRIRGFLVFRPLSDRARAEIATSAVVRVAAEYGLTVVRVAPAVVSGVVGRPYDRLGARPDEYYIDDVLGSVFSRYATSGGNRTVAIEAGPPPACVPAG
jgi:ATP-dependent Clp protease ATP-binding subunit ClpA